jgi:hypothetical protein
MMPGSMGRVCGSWQPSSKQRNGFPPHTEAGTPLGKFRKRIVPGFPYNIIYRVWDYIYIDAVAHQHRRPGYWRE